MNKNFSCIFDGIFDKPVGKSEILFSILFIVIVQINIQVVKVLVSLSVLFGSHFEDMRDSQLEQVFGFEASDKVAIIQLGQNLDRVKTL